MNLIEKDNNAINLVYGTTLMDGDNLHAPSPWIILHRLCHTIYSHDYYDYDEGIIFERMLEMLYKSKRFNRDASLYNIYIKSR